MKIAYGRVSSRDQSLQRQLDAFALEGVEKVFSEKISGKSTDGRTELKKAIDFAREGDTLVILSFDRLARSLHDLLDIVMKLESKKVFLKSLHENIDLSTPSGRLMMSVIGAFAEFERNIIAERREEGIESAKAKGKKFGRPKVGKPKNYDAIIAKWKAGEITAVQAAKDTGLTIATFYRMTKAEGEKS